MEEYNHGLRILNFPHNYGFPSPTINVPFKHVTKPTINNFLTNKLIRALLCIMHSLL